MSTENVKIYPATYEQEAMWAADQLAEGTSRYLESWALKLLGPLDLRAAEWALSRLVERHESLRTRLEVDGDELVQVVLPPPRRTMALARRSCAHAEVDAELRGIVRKPLGPEPVRATVLCLSSEEFILVLQVHHTVVDDWAFAIIDQEFQELYTAYVQGRAPQLPPVAQLGGYAVAQRSAGRDEGVLAYWRDRLHHAPMRNAPPADRPRPVVPSWRGSQMKFSISEDAARQVHQVCRAGRTTPFTVFAAVLSALLAWYNETDEVILGTPVSRRGTAELDGMVGCLTDLLPLRQRSEPDDSFSTLIAATHDVVWSAIAHRGISYAELLAKAVRRKEIGRRPLCQAVLVVDDVRQARLILPGLVTERMHIPSGVAKFDLCLTIVAEHGRYNGFLDYALDLYEKHTAERVVRQFTQLLGAVVAAPAAPLATALRALREARLQ